MPHWKNNTFAANLNLSQSLVDSNLNRKNPLGRGMEQSDSSQKGIHIMKKQDNQFLNELSSIKLTNYFGDILVSSSPNESRKILTTEKKKKPP